MTHLSRRVHGALDYLVGLFLVLSPKLLHLPSGAPAEVPVVLGVAAVGYSVLTKYEFGALRWLAFRTHLTLDVLHALILGTSPWLFGFSERIFWPHVILGLLELGVVLLTRTEPASAVPRSPHAPLAPT